MNPAYKHLEAKTRIAELTLAQWALIATALIGAVAWGFYISPFGFLITVLTSTYIGGLPALAALVAGQTEFDFWLTIRHAVRHWRSDGRYLPGPGPTPAGYVIGPHPRELRRRGAGGPGLDLEELWAS
jgi:hypothetical protein